MRFVQKDAIFNTFEWSETETDSGNYQTGLDAFSEFDYSVLTDEEVNFLNYVINSNFGFRQQEYRGSTPIEENKEFRWFFVDAILNFAPTNSEITQSLTNLGDGTDLASEFWDIFESQFKIIQPGIDGKYTSRKQTNSYIANDLTSLYHWEYNMLMSSLEKRSLIMLKFAASKFKNEAKRWGISLEGMDEFYSNGKLPIIKVGNIDNLLKTFTTGNKRPGDFRIQQNYPILIGTEKLSLDGSTRGIPQPNIFELIFYLRLKYGIGASEDEILSKKSSSPTYFKNNGEKLNRSGVFEDDKYGAPYRMRYVNQFLLPEPKVPSSYDPNFFSEGIYAMVTELEHPAIHFDLDGTPDRHELDVSKYTKIQKNEINKHYFSLWCLPNDEFTNKWAFDNNVENYFSVGSSTKYIPTGFPTINKSYKIYTNHETDSILYNYTINDYVRNPQFQPNTWYQNGDILHSRWFDTNSLEFGDGGYFGLRGGIPCKYLSLLTLDANIKGRRLLEKCLSFSKFIEKSYKAGEILPVVVDAKDVSKISNPETSNSTKALIPNPFSDLISQGYVPEDPTNNQNPYSTNTYTTDTVGNYVIQYVSNISDVKTLMKSGDSEKISYHQRAWTKSGTGVDAKISIDAILFELKTWGNNKLFQPGEEDWDYYENSQLVLSPIEGTGIDFNKPQPTNLFRWKSIGNFNSPECDIGKFDAYYMRNIIQPDLSDIFGSSWLDYQYKHPNEINNPLWPITEHTRDSFEARIYLVISQAAARLTYNEKFESLTVVNGGPLTLDQNKILTELINGSSLQGETLSRNEFNGSNSKSKVVSFLNDAKKIRSSAEVYWLTNAITFLNQVCSSATQWALKRVEVKYGANIFSKYYTNGYFDQKKWDSVVRRSIIQDRANKWKPVGADQRRFLHVKSNKLRSLERMSYASKILHDSYYKLPWTYTKIALDLWGFLANPTIFGFLKSSISITNSVISQWGWYSLTDETAPLLGVSIREKLKALGKNGSRIFGWATTFAFLVVDQFVQGADLNIKREEHERLKEEAHKSDYLEGVYIQSQGAIKIKKNKDGSLPIDYSDKKVKYQNNQDDVHQTASDRIIKSNDELMGEKGKLLFWDRIDQEECKVLMDILNRNPSVVDSAPNHLDLGIHTSDIDQSFERTKFSQGLAGSSLTIPISVQNALPQFFTPDDTKPYINAELLYLNNMVNTSTLMGGSSKINFIPKFKYSRIARTGITFNTPLPQYFNGNAQNVLEEFSLDIQRLPDNAKVLNKKSIPLPIGDKEKVYLIRRKYGLYLVNPNIGKKLKISTRNENTTPQNISCCCTMTFDISDQLQYDFMEFPNDGNGKKNYSEYDGIGGCKYLINFNNEQFKSKLREKCEEQSNREKRESRSCFAADTKIMTPNGEINISDIKVGDEVLAFDLDKQIKKSIVTKLFKHSDEKSEIYRYKLSNGLYIDTTKNHPFLTLNNKFVEIGFLNIGDELIDFLGNSIKIESFEFLRIDEVYNITVKEYHTYIANGIMVHNKPIKLPDDLPITIYNDEVDYLVDTTIETSDLNDPPVFDECVMLGICNDVTCATCEMEPKYIKICSIPQFCLSPKLSNGLQNTIPTWLYSWITYDFRVNWSDVVKTITTVYSWWDSKTVDSLKISYKSFIPKGGNYDLFEQPYESSLFFLELPPITFDMDIDWNFGTTGQTVSQTNSTTHVVKRRFNRNTNSGTVINPIVYPTNSDRIIFTPRNPSDNTRTRNRRTGGAASGAGG